MPWVTGLLVCGGSPVRLRDKWPLLCTRMALARQAAYEVVECVRQSRHTRYPRPYEQAILRCAQQARKALDTSDDTVARYASNVTYVLRMLCDERFLVFRYTDVPASWRRLHVDAILVRVCAAIAGAPVPWCECIADLDQALIISGAPEREACVHALIAHTQALVSETAEAHATQCSGTHKRRRCIPANIDTASTTYGTHVYTRNPALKVHAPAVPIPERPAPTIQGFLASCPPAAEHGCPFIVRGYARDWPARRRWHDDEYLRERAGPCRVVPVEKGASYTDADWGQTLMPWALFLDQIQWGRLTKDTPQPLYLAQHTLMQQFPWVAEDLRTPDYVYACPTGGTVREPVTSVWIGPANTVSPAHTDPYYNCYVQVVGCKEVWIAPPDADPNAMRAYDDNEADLFLAMMHNTSHVDVFGELTPRFREAVESRAMRAELAEGDLLFLPPRWWHSMRSKTQSFSVSFWFQ